MITIIIPTREEEHAIEATVCQFRGLRLPHEVIVSDDRSLDRTVEVARTCANITITADNDARQSPARARNAGARVSQGDILVFIDATVAIPHPNAFFEHALARFAHEPRLVALTGPQRADPTIETWGDRTSFGILNFILRIRNNLLHKGEASGKIMIVRRSAFDRVNGLREDLITREDGDFFLRLSRIGKTHFDPHLMIYHSARRAHAIGWRKLWWIWATNVIALAFLRKPLADDWTPVR
ncbi:glycosyltransferase [Candidatus Kaiserbacteria bacterium]|nr:glycosyltransferase [Candidatus Kaiserbacteria bacterium]